MAKDLKEKARNIKLVISDCDGVLTDGCVYYSSMGEELKKFSLRDGMGVERLRKICGVETGIMTRENSQIVARRAEKLKIKHLYMGIEEKEKRFLEVLTENGLAAEDVAYIGDDVNDVEVLKMAGLSACPADAIDLIKPVVHYICQNPGGAGAFRELAELIIQSHNQT
jgi:3-deoxy-D-manno-octulosonate 8-phosphate phosphatase (KDO 8-P phosphatase)